MVELCPECGAGWSGDENCQAVFDQFLALEFSDLGYGQVHFLTVACYMIQHGQYSDEALVWIKEQLRAYLEDNLPIEEIRRSSTEKVSSQHRDWKVTRSEEAPPAEKVNWSMTIMDVARNYQDAPSYRGLIRQWAEATLAEMP